MYSKLAFFVISAFTLGALAAPQDPAPAPVAPPAPSNHNECSGGKVNCCNSVEDAKSSAVQNLAGSLGIPLGALTGQVGLNCVPVGVLGVSGNNCASQPVCCKGNNFGGLITLACNPINVNL